MAMMLLTISISLQSQKDFSHRMYSLTNLKLEQVRFGIEFRVKIEYVTNAQILQ